MRPEEVTLSIQSEGKGNHGRPQEEREDLPGGECGIALGPELTQVEAQRGPAADNEGSRHWNWMGDGAQDHATVLKKPDASPFGRDESQHAEGNAQTNPSKCGVGACPDPDAEQAQRRPQPEKSLGFPHIDGPVRSGLHGDGSDCAECDPTGHPKRRHEAAAYQDQKQEDITPVRRLGQGQQHQRRYEEDGHPAREEVRGRERPIGHAFGRGIAPASADGQPQEQDQQRGDKTGEWQLER